MAEQEGQIEGLKEVYDIIKTFSDETEVNKLLRSANRVSLTPLKATYKTLPFSQRLLSTVTIGQPPTFKKRYPNAQAVGPTTDSFVLRFLEVGTVERYIKEGASGEGKYAAGSFKGASRGRIKASGAIESFLDKAAPGVETEVTKQYGEVFLKEVQTKSKRINRNK